MIYSSMTLCLGSLYLYGYPAALYSFLLSKLPWALEIHAKKGVGAYMEKPIECRMYSIMHMNYRIINNGGGGVCGRLHRDGSLLGRSQYYG